MKRAISITLLSLLLVTAKAQSKKAKLFRYVKLVPLSEWTDYDEPHISAHERDSLILEAQRSDMDYKGQLEKGSIHFSREYPSFTLFEARDNRDLLIEVLTIGRWMSTTKFWQYDPVKKILKNVTRSFGRKEPSIKSYFPDDFSFSGKDTLNEVTDLMIQAIPFEGKLRYYLTTDRMDSKNWINEAADKNLIYTWVGTWNGEKFIWKRQIEN